MSPFIKRTLACLLAVLLTACAVTSCTPGKPPQETTASTEAETSASEEKPNEPEENGFAERLEAALQRETKLFLEFDIRQKHIYSATEAFEAAFYARLQGDLQNGENPCFAYSIHTSAEAEPEMLLFYDEGILYRRDSEEQYRYPLAWERAREGIPFHALQALFGEDWKEIFSEARITEAEDGSVTAVTEIPLGAYLENVRAYLKHFGGNRHEQMQAADGGLTPIRLSVTLEPQGRMSSYAVEIVMEAPDGQGGVYPVIYTVSAVSHAAKEDFTVEMPSKEEREAYAETEPDITEISLADFVRRFALADEMSAKAVYTKMTTNAKATYRFGESFFEVPLSDVTQIDLSDPTKPNVSVVEIIDLLGTVEKTEIYYKDEVYYYSVGGRKYSAAYPAEQYLANVQASAKEKAEAGISTFFMTDAMLSHAILTVNPNQSVSAVTYFNGETQRDNIFYQIKSLYNDDFGNMPDAKISNACVSVTLDRYHYLTAYSLEVTVLSNADTGPSELHYFIEYRLEYSERETEIVFPDGLNTENYPPLA